MSNHAAYLEQLLRILKKYSLASIVEGTPVEQINSLILKHREELTACDTFEKALVIANRAVEAVSGYSIKIESFITNRDDLMAMYRVLIDWRNTVLVHIQL